MFAFFYIFSLFFSFFFFLFYSFSLFFLLFSLGPSQFISCELCCLFQFHVWELPSIHSFRDPKTKPMSELAQNGVGIPYFCVEGLFIQICWYIGVGFRPRHLWDFIKLQMAMVELSPILLGAGSWGRSDCLAI